jgi:hypothetical protein
LQYRALRGGARLGRAIGRGSENGVDEYDRQAALVLNYVQVSIWEGVRPAIIAAEQKTKKLPTDFLERERRIHD